jgi:hypothetical protein
MREPSRPIALSSVVVLAALLGAGRVRAQEPVPMPAPETDLPPIETTPVPVASPGAPGGLQIEGPGGASVKLGFLLQPGFEFADGSAASGDDSAYFFLRRARLLLGMNLGSQFELFVMTDAPNLGKVPPVPAGVAGSTGANMQDAYATWKPADEFKVDMGLMLPPFSHNSLQSAASLYSWDYFTYSFQQSAGLTNYVSRDTGLQVRGLVANQLEYRVAVLQGNRAVPAMGPLPSRTALRFAARIQYNFLDPETAFLYAGTYGGTKRILSLGVGIDAQDDYRALAADAFVDLPFGSDVFTVQVNVLRYDGGSYIALPAQTAIMFEAGVRLSALDLSPILRVESLGNSDAMATDVLRVSGGVAWWVMNHNINVKLFYTYVKPDSPGLTWSQINLQTQFFVF